MPHRDKGQGIRDKGRRQETRKKGKGFLPQRDKTLPLDREESEVAHVQMAKRNPASG